jgi:hypothetical protein
MATRARTKLRQVLAQAVAWFGSGPGRPVATVLLVLLAGQLAFAWYEYVRLGLPLVREEPALFDAYHLLQSGFAITVSITKAAGRTSSPPAWPHWQLAARRR